MGLFSVYTVSLLSLMLIGLKLSLDSSSRLPIPEFSGYHCISEYILFNSYPWQALSFIKGTV